MATLERLKSALRQAMAATQAVTKPLSDSEYAAGFDFMRAGSEQIYQDFIITQLSRMFEPVCITKTGFTVLEIGPGPDTVLAQLPDRPRSNIEGYSAFEPNQLYASTLEDKFRQSDKKRMPLPCLKGSPEIWRRPFGMKVQEEIGEAIKHKYDFILFCHSMYGLKKRKCIVEALETWLAPRGKIVLFHRDGNLQLDGLVCSYINTYSTGVVRIKDDDDILDRFAAFVAGFTLSGQAPAKADWRGVCRALGRADQGHLLFAAPELVMSLTHHAIALPELTTLVPRLQNCPVKNYEARSQLPACMLMPKQLWQVQECVYWALKHETSLTVFAGGHSGHCVRPNVVAINMSAFNKVHLVESGADYTVAIVEAGCKAIDVIRETIAQDLTIPLGSRPSVGAGLWLQGGMGHLGRIHGLSCDSIIGGVMVSVKTGQILYFGHVPPQHRPQGSIHADNESDLIWAIKGAGSHIGIVISVTFKTCPASNFSIRTWSKRLVSDSEGCSMLNDLNRHVASILPRHCSIDIHLYLEQSQLCMGLTLIETHSKTGKPDSGPIPMLGPEDLQEFVDGIKMFDSEFHMKSINGGHHSGKTSSFKRCVFLKDIGAADVANVLLSSTRARPSPSCYLHLLQGGGAIKDIASDATAFACRDWDFACVVTGVWPRDQDGHDAARAAVDWVYAVVCDLLPLSCGIYSADLGPDVRDASLTPIAFGTNHSRLSLLKATLDPKNVLAHTCPVNDLHARQKVIFIVTGQHGAGKDYCAGVWASTCELTGLKTRVISISDAAKRDYAEATGANFDSLREDRSYKEHHRERLLAHYQAQVHRDPRLPEQHFINTAIHVYTVDALFITGMRDAAVVATLSHLLPGIKLVEIRVTAGAETKRLRRGQGHTDEEASSDDSNSPCLTFHNEESGPEAATQFCKDRLILLLHNDVQRLTHMVHRVPDFPRAGIVFHDVLGITKHANGLALCTSLLRSRLADKWPAYHAVVCCEAGGFVFASALAHQVALPLLLIRQAGKLPPPTVSIHKNSSYISASASGSDDEQRIEIGADSVGSHSSVVVVDDVLSSGETLRAVLQLLVKAGVRVDKISVLVVAELPVHRGRALLQRDGLGAVNIQSLLVFPGA